MIRNYISARGRILLFVAFIVVGSKAIISFNLQRLTNSNLNGFAPNATTDVLIKDLIGQSNPQLVPLLDKQPVPTEVLHSTIARLPKDKAILFVGSPQAPGYLQMRLIMNYLSWPHPVYAPACGWPYAWDTPPDATQVAGAVYYLVQPPPTMAIFSEPIPGMIITTASEKASWDSYCAP